MERWNHGKDVEAAKLPHYQSWLSGYWDHQDTWEIVQSSGAANSVCLVLILKELTSLLMKTEAKESNSSGDIREMKCKSC